MTGMARMASLALVLSGLIVAVACGSDPIVRTTECVPGEAIACGGSTCSKVCGSDGLYGACTCVDASVVIDSGPDAAPDVGVEAGVEAEAEAGPITWGHAFAPPDGVSYAVAVDKNQNAIVAGKGSGLGAGLTKLTPSGAVLWQKSFSFVYRVATDSAGAVYALGSSAGNEDFGGGTVSATGAYLAKFDAAGVYQWLLGPFTGQANEVRVRANGNVVVVGVLQGTGFDFGGGMLTPSLSGGDGFIVEVTGAKAHVSSKLYASAGGTTSFTAAALDASDDLIVAGVFNGTTINLGGATLALTDGASFLVKLGPAMTYVAQNQALGQGLNRLASLDVSPAGHVFVGGEISASLQWGTAPVVAIGPPNVFVSRLDGNLGEVWTKRFGGVSGQSMNGLAADPSGGVVITGWTRGNLYFGLPGMPSVEAGYIARFDANGNVVANRGLVVPNASATGHAVANVSGPDFVVVGTCTGGNMSLPSGPIVCKGGDLVGFAARLSP
ncbi:hypothetical protein BH09MYX1_BH09MYX1_46000 [soil metagenome]